MDALILTHDTLDSGQTLPLPEGCHESNELWGDKTVFSHWPFGGKAGILYMLISTYVLITDIWCITSEIPVRRNESGHNWWWTLWSFNGLVPSGMNADIDLWLCMASLSHSELNNWPGRYMSGHTQHSVQIKTIYTSTLLWIHSWSVEMA